MHWFPLTGLLPTVTIQDACKLIAPIQYIAQYLFPGPDTDTDADPDAWDAIAAFIDIDIDIDIDINIYINCHS